MRTSNNFHTLIVDKPKATPKPSNPYVNIRCSSSVDSLAAPMIHCLYYFWHATNALKDKRRNRRNLSLSAN